MDVTEFKCRKCNCISKGQFEIKTDIDKKEKFDQNHKKRLELRAEQEIILKEFEDIVKEHNSHWYNFLSEWYVSPRPFDDYLDIVDFNKSKPIKSAPYDSSVVGFWLNFIHKKPHCEYIECPVCKCKNYMDRC